MSTVGFDEKMVFDYISNQEKYDGGVRLFMPRPLRIEYENAFYHVMNRGRERQMIFQGDKYYFCFFGNAHTGSVTFKRIVHAIARWVSDVS